MFDLFLSLIHCPHPNCPSVLDFAPVTQGETLGVYSSPRNENCRRQEQGVNGSRERPGKPGGIFCVAISCGRGWSQKWQGEKVTWHRGKPSAFSLSMLRLLSPKSSILEPLNIDEPQLICVWSPVIFLAGKDSSPIISRYNLIFNLLRKIESKRRRGQRRIKWLDSITDSMDMNLNSAR